MTAPKVVGFVDIGKTNARFALVDLATLGEIAVRRAPNTMRRDGLYPHYDTDRLWDFLTGAIAEHAIDALSVTTHGASAALIDADGALAMPVLDYEFAGPDQMKADYDKVRPDFSESFTPRLPGGLNLGAQIFWQSRCFPDAFARTRWILPYPQYFSFRLTGVPAAMKLPAVRARVPLAVAFRFGHKSADCTLYCSRASWIRRAVMRRSRLLSSAAAISACSREPGKNSRQPIALASPACSGACVG